MASPVDAAKDGVSLTNFKPDIKTISLQKPHCRLNWTLTLRVAYLSLLLLKHSYGLILWDNLKLMANKA
jgi:hypothetical protein